MGGGGGRGFRERERDRLDLSVWVSAAANLLLLHNSLNLTPGASVLPYSGLQYDLFTPVSLGFLFSFDFYFFSFVKIRIHYSLLLMFSSLC